MRLGYRAARLYGYSNARVKAMESKLVSKELLGEISRIDNVPTILTKLLQTDYRPYIEQFGDISKRADLVDFALNRSLAVSAEKLVRIAPKRDAELIARIVGIWDIYNIKLVLHAKSIGRGVDYISRYLVETKYFSSLLVKDALSEPDVEGAATKLMRLQRYRGELRAAIAVYKRTGNMTEVNAAIDKEFYEQLGGTINALEKASPSAAKLVRLNIEMKNMLTLIRAKRYKMSSQTLNGLLINGGSTQVGQLIKLYDGSRDVHELVEGIRTFNLKKPLEIYESDRSRARHMLIFEIAMRNQIFKRAMSLLRHTVLSFGVLVGYFYLKEVEVFTLRITIIGRSLGLTSEEISSMIEWQT